MTDKYCDDDDTLSRGGGAVLLLLDGMIGWEYTIETRLLLGFSEVWRSIIVRM